MSDRRLQFDSHRFVKRLTKAGISTDMAIKADIADMATKADVAASEQRPRLEIAEAKVSMIKWTIATQAVFAAVIIAVAGTFLP